MNTPAQPTTRMLWSILGAGALLGLLIGLFAGPGLTAPRQVAGDPDLAQRTQRLLGGSRSTPSLGVVLIDGGDTRRADLGPSARYHQLGSITKTFNGHLLADAVRRGEVALDDPLARHLPELAGSPAGTVTLVELASHRSGLPRLMPGQVIRAIGYQFSLRNPYRDGTPEMIEQTRGVKLADRGTFAYSNLGSSLLGHALARAARQPDWPSLVQDRLFGPLGMTDTVIATSPDRIPADAAPGRTAAGARPEAWTSAADAPSGTSTWTTVEDMTRYARAILDRTVPGPEALDPRWAAGPSGQIGLHWLTTSAGSTFVRWHNGATAGGTSYLGIERDRQRAVVVLNDSGADVTGLGESLLLTLDQPADRLSAIRQPTPWPGLFVLGLFVAMLGVLVFRGVRRGPRLALLSAGADTVTVGILAWRLGPWQSVPGAAFGALAGVAVAAVALGVRDWGARAWAGPRPVGQWLSAAISAVFLAAVLGLTLFG